MNEHGSLWCHTLTEIPMSRPVLALWCIPERPSVYYGAVVGRDDSFGPLRGHRGCYSICTQSGVCCLTKNGESPVPKLSASLQICYRIGDAACGGRAWLGKSSRR